MSSSDKKKTSNRAHALAAWEWFKEAAWLQVLLIVAVVVGLVVAIPFVVQGIVDALNDDDSSFYESHRIDYKTFKDYINGEDNACDGIIGDDTTDENGKFNTDVSKAENLGFVVMFYKSNCSDCDTLETRIENWYDNFNSSYGNGKINFYTIDCSWDDDDDDDASKYEGQIDKYDNQYITLDDEQEVIDSVRDVYLDQDSKHTNSSVTETTLNTKIQTGSNDSSTIFTPLFVTYSKARDAAKYDIASPMKVIFDNINGLSLSSETDVAKMMLDIYNFQVIK